MKVERCSGAEKTLGFEGIKKVEGVYAPVGQSGVEFIVVGTSPASVLHYTPATGQLLTILPTGGGWENTYQFTKLDKKVYFETK